ncbi:replication initiator A domain-containing protein, partial [Neglecta sp. X4]|nr:replication initiator A domain-containing protein [Neglectibacter sp. X4]NCE82018.1 replication initiator A domain-containing protein [Neglectibacter sp. X58]
TAEKPQSAPLKTSGQECGISAPNNTDINKTEKSDTDLSITPPAPSAVSSPAGKRAPRRMGLDEMESCRELILENIDYDILLERNPWDKDLLDGYVELMLEICCSTRESVRICGQEVPTEVVKSRFLKLNSEHIGYVMDSLKSNTAKIGNINAYTLAALYNAPVTMGQYYTSLVSHDMAHGLLDG